MTAGPVDAPSADSPTTGLRIDPNAAPWWELCVLPEIGETTAKTIVAFREHNADGRRPVFQNAADLDRVPGIGPKTIARIALYLRFPETMSH